MISLIYRPPPLSECHKKQEAFNQTLRTRLESCKQRSRAIELLLSQFLVNEALILYRALLVDLAQLSAFSSKKKEYALLEEIQVFIDTNDLPSWKRLCAQVLSPPENWNAKFYALYLDGTTIRRLFKEIEGFLRKEQEAQGKTPLQSYRLQKKKQLLNLFFCMTVACTIIFLFIHQTAANNRQIAQRQLLDDRRGQRIHDLLRVKEALQNYYAANKEYPKNSSWDGYLSCWGKSDAQWIAGLVPKYLAELPRDPRKSSICSEQYLYRSDGINFKLLAHQPDDCALVKTAFPDLIDPNRQCGAYGYWTEGGKYY